MTDEQEIAPPPRFLLRPAGVLTQILCAFALLLGTISFILVQQNKTGGAALVIAWAAAAMAGVVFGGLMSRGGLVSVIASALIVGAFGTVLMLIDWDALRSLLRLLPEDDVSMIADILVVVAIVMISTSVLSFAAIPQARAYNRALREAEAEAAKSGFFEAQPSGEMPRQFQVPITLPGRATRTQAAQLDPALMTTERAPSSHVGAPSSMHAPHSMHAATPGSMHTSGRGPEPEAQVGARGPEPAHGSMPIPRGPEPATLPRKRNTSPVAVPPMPPALAPGMTFRAGMGSSSAHTSAYSPHPGAPQSPALGPAYRDSPPAMGASPAMPGAGPNDGPPSMPPPVGAQDGPPLMPGRVSDRALPLPAPPPTGDGFAPPPPVQPPLEEHVPNSADTAPGWTPSPARTYTTMMIVRPPQVEQRSRRRVYMMLGGFAIGLGAGVGVLVSSLQNDKRDEIAATTGSGSGSGSAKTSASTTIKAGTPASSTTSATTTATEDAGTVAATVDAGTVEIDAAIQLPPLHNFLDAQRDLIGTGDLAKLAQTFAPTAFGIGIDADDVAEGRDAIEAMLTKNLGDPPPDGFKVTSKFLAIGQEDAVAWTAEEIELSGPNLAPRRMVITQLVTATGGAWSVLALCWAQTVRDETAERLAILGTLPKPKPIVDRIDGAELGAAAKAAFASRKAFADARSERDDAFNFGSGPGERIVGGAKIKALFSRLRAELRLDGGVRVVTAGNAGFAAVNAIYTQKGRAATDVSQTFRVLAVFLKEGTAWKIVQTQFSNAGPISE